MWWMPHRGPDGGCVPGEARLVIGRKLKGPRCASSRRGAPRERSPGARRRRRVKRHPLVDEGPPAWARAWGEDRFGPFATLQVEGTRQRFRWLPPGTYVRGSPEHEAGRWDHEGPQHEVTLTQGFWLGDTPVTQALWRAVMGENPSRFVDPERPVERVSWDDVQAFGARLGELHPALAPRLPSEAEWEYACRAGTHEATWAGDLELLGVRHAPQLDVIAWYGGNSGVGYDLDEAEDTSGWEEQQHPRDRAGPRKVATQQPNPWGLYDMLGNVWEWCADADRDF